MVKSYLKIAWRNLAKHKSYTAINVFGLAVGMSCFLLILFYIKDEASFDKFHKDYKQIYRITEVNYGDDGETMMANAFSAIGPALKSDIPELETYVRIHITDVPVSNGPEKRFQEKEFAFADSTIWDVFDFKLLKGNPKTALSAPFSIVLTESMATKYFGAEEAVGQVLKVDDQYTFNVTGVVQDIPLNSHLRFDFLASFLSLKQIEGGWKYNNWYWPPMYTYAKIPEAMDIKSVEAKFPAMVEKYLGKMVAEQRGYKLQPLEEIHTTSNYSNEIGDSTNITYLYVMTTTAFFILAIACVNFMNLSLARSLGRSTEVGVRKVFGAVRKQVIFQYLSESILVTILASLIGLGLFLLAIPAFNDLSDKSLSVSWGDIPLILAGLLALALVVGVLSGIYPALFLSGLSPAAILKGKMAKQGKFTAIFKKGLITFQFVISAILVIATFIIFFQLSYMRNKALGFDKEQMVVLQLGDMWNSKSIKVLKDRINQLPQVIGTSVSSRVPGNENFYEYNVLADGESVENNMVFMRVETDLDFIDLYGLTLADGRSFNSKLATDSATYLLNQTAADKLGWGNDALNKKLNIGTLTENGTFDTNHQGTIIGVLDDFNFASLHNKIDPVVVTITSNETPYMQALLSVKLQPGNLIRTMNIIEEEWKAFAPSIIFDYFFLDDSVERMYSDEKQLGKVFVTFSTISIVLACLGLFAMTTLLAAQMRKEIGIRKVLGASLSNIVLLMSKSYMQLILLSFIIASAITYLVMGKWLENFAYQIELEIWYFLSAGALLAIIAFTTMSIKSIKAAKGNPVDALRYE